jgi:hypothetical protein
MKAKSLPLPTEYLATPLPDTYIMKTAGEVDEVIAKPSLLGKRHLPKSSWQNHAARALVDFAESSGFKDGEAGGQAGKSATISQISHGTTSSHIAEVPSGTNRLIPVGIVTSMGCMQIQNLNFR